MAAVADRGRQVQYELIAEEVAEIYPELVTTNAQGEPTGVRYHVLPTMLLNELQRQQRQLTAHSRSLTSCVLRCAPSSRSAPPSWSGTLIRSVDREPRGRPRRAAVASPSPGDCLAPRRCAGAPHALRVARLLVRCA